MKTNNQMGFSLIELLLVVVIIGVIATLAVPALLKAKQSSENGNAFASLRTMLSSEVSFFSQNSRYGRLAEINQMSNGSLGVLSPPNSLVRGRFTFTMTDAESTDAQLKSSFHITATKAAGSDELPYTLNMDQSGRIIEIYGSN